MKIKYLLISLIFLEVFSSCEKECEVENEMFSQADLQWFQYELADRLVYVNDSADLDTFEIKNVSISNVGDPNVGQAERQCYLPIKGSYRMENRDSSRTTLFSLTKDNRRENDYSFYFYIDGFLAASKEIENLGKVNINGVEYTDVYFAEENSSNLGSIISNLKFNKDVGLIQYEIRDKSTWTIQEIIKGNN